MRKKLVAILLALAFSVCGFWNLNAESYAQEDENNTDMSYLMTESSLIGYTENMTRGIYLVNGFSVINRISSTKIGAGGVTNASQYCKVSVTAIVERETSAGWERVTSWTTTSNYGITAAVDRSLNVGTGYYYRVRCSHYAASDYSSSWTDGLRM